MKKRILSLSIITLIILSVSGITFAWYTNQKSETNEFALGTVKVEVLEPGFENVSGASEGIIYSKNVKVKSLGTKKTYIRVRLVPQWTNPSLPVSNVNLIFASNSDWIDGGDGYYYFKYYLIENQETSLLLQGVEFTSLGPEYQGEVFSLKVVAEGVQISNGAWMDVWGLSSLPFTPNQPFTE